MKQEVTPLNVITAVIENVYNNTSLLCTGKFHCFLVIVCSCEEYVHLYCLFKQSHLFVFILAFLLYALIKNVFFFFFQ